MRAAPAGRVSVLEPAGRASASARAGLALDDVNLFACDAALAPKSHAGTKLQRRDPRVVRRARERGGGDGLAARREERVVAAPRSEQRRTGGQVL